jgi:hypothetical protein
MSFDFIDKRLFKIKIGRKSIFHIHEAHILPQLDVNVI